MYISANFTDHKVGIGLSSSSSTGLELKSVPRTSFYFIGSWHWSPFQMGLLLPTTTVSFPLLSTTQYLVDLYIGIMCMGNLIVTIEVSTHFLDGFDKPCYVVCSIISNSLEQLRTCTS